MIEEIRELYAYNRWANERILDAVAVLTEEELGRELGGSFPSVRKTLVHIASAEWIWLERWQGRSPTGIPEGWDLSGLGAIRAVWDEVDEQRDHFLHHLDDNALHAVVDYRNTAGQPFAEPLWQQLRHVVNHSSYHRGQVVNMLRLLGAKTVGTDLIAYYRG